MFLFFLRFLFLGCVSCLGGLILPEFVEDLVSGRSGLLLSSEMLYNLLLGNVFFSTTYVTLGFCLGVEHTLYIQLSTPCQSFADWMSWGPVYHPVGPCKPLDPDRRVLRL